jgi:hypothetical protein
MTRHPLSIVGSVLATLSAFLFIFVFLIDALGLHSNPYFGLMFFVVLPIIFVIGLLMIPLGILFERRRREQGLPPRRMPTIDLGNPLHQRRIVIFLALTFVNVMIVSLAAYRAVEYMDTPQFCGQVCHTVMEPEFTAHRDGAHSQVSCVECHVGSGAQSYLYYKLNGARQLVHLVTNNYPRPIPSPVFNLRPARETCQMCHTAEKFHGDKVAVVPDYASDEANTNNSTKMTLHVGGGRPEFGMGAGIHWHSNPQNEIEFVATDEQRQQIPYVRLKDATGTVREFRAPGVTDAQIAAGERRRMDCVDCHNRPTHAFFASPERAVDAAFARGAMPGDLPFARREAVAALKATYPDAAAADRAIAERLRAFYAEAGEPPAKSGSGGRGPKVEQLVRAAQFLYTRSVFPKMNVTWGTHPDNLGHTDAPGCFRCHDGEHKTADGQEIRQDCEMCHAIE